MKSKLFVIILIAVFAVLTVVNLAIYAKENVTIRVEGTGNAFKKTEGSTTTWGCDRANENKCSMTIIVTDQ